MRLTWLEGVLRRALEPAGYTVRTVTGWETRGRSLSGPMLGIVDHHTASSRASGPSGSLRIVIYGRPGLTGPLAQVHDSRDAVTTVIAAGRAQHAGYGTWPGGANPNSVAIGRESENDGVGEPWPTRQRDAEVIGDAAILTHLRRPATAALGHREVDPRRKIDPTYDMDDHRRRIARHMTTGGNPPGKDPIMAALTTDQVVDKIVRTELIVTQLQAEVVGVTDKDGTRHDRLIRLVLDTRRDLAVVAAALARVQGVVQTDLEAQLVDIAERRDDAAALLAKR